MRRSIRSDVFLLAKAVFEVFRVNNINRPSDIASCDSTRNYFCKSRSTNGFQSGGIAAIAI